MSFLEPLAGLEPDAAALDRQRRAHMAETAARLRMAADRIAQLNSQIDDQARSLRTMGATWSEIGEALLISRQAAQQRFGSVSS